MSKYDGPLYTREWYLAVNGFEDGTPEADAAWGAKQAFEASKSRVQLMPDIGEYVSTVDGTFVSSRTAHREHIRRHDLVEIGNEPIRPKPAAEMPNVVSDIKRTMQEYATR